MSSSWRGVTSNSTALAGGRSRNERMGLLVSMRQPWARARAASASTICCEPPSAHGQSMACAAIARVKPNEAEPHASSGRNEWAPFPASSARAAAPLNRLAIAAHDRSPTRPNRAISNGWRGTRIGRRISLNSASWRATKGPSRPPPRRPILPERRNGPLQLSRQHRNPAVVQRVRQGHWRGNPLQAIGPEVQTRKDRGHAADRVDRPADVVGEARQGQRFGAAAAADSIVPLEDR